MAVLTVTAPESQELMLLVFVQTSGPMGSPKGHTTQLYMPVWVCRPTPRIGSWIKPIDLPQATGLPKGLENAVLNDYDQMLPHCLLPFFFLLLSLPLLIIRSQAVSIPKLGISRAPTILFKSEVSNIWPISQI